MPVAIIIFETGEIPAILQERDDASLLQAMNALKATPELADPPAAKLWLAELAEPSGWYDSPEIALAFIRRMKDAERLGGAEVAEARARLGLSRAAFAEALGYGGNSNTRHKTILEVERDNKTLSVPATRALRAIMAEAGMTKERAV